MPSPACISFLADLGRARTLAAVANDKRLRPISRIDAQTCFHAALAAYVACWDSYVKALLNAFMQETADPTVAKFIALHEIVRERADAFLKRFNTPSAENCRELLTSFTGYDPINDWIWPRRRMSGLAVRERLNQILKVRHSFAHGFVMPSYEWNTSKGGDVRLTQAAIKETETFIENLVRQTDRGMAGHIRTTYNSQLPW